MGNLSFYYEMVERDKLGFMNSPENYEIIKCESTQKFFKSIKLKKNIIKIDTQGYDEIIFQEIPKSVLKKNQILAWQIMNIYYLFQTFRKFIYIREPINDKK